MMATRKMIPNVPARATKFENRKQKTVVEERNWGICVFLAFFSVFVPAV